MKKFAALLSCITILALSCRKELPPVLDPEQGVANTYSDVFERFWSQMNSRYQFWDVDTTDWDAMYARYQPLFATLDINNEDDQLKSFQYFKAMLDGAVDGHMVFYLDPPVVYDSGVYPRYRDFERFRNPNRIHGETQRTPDYYAFNYYAIDSSRYLDGSGMISGTYKGASVLCGTVKGTIFYLGFNQELMTPALQEADNNVFKEAYKAFQDALHNKPNLKGLIIDMRGSLGGYGSDGNILASQMIGQRLLRGSLKYKSGPGRLDYTPWANTYIDPAPGAKAIRVPLIILTDFATYSAAEYVTSALHAIPGTVTVGTATGGGSTGNSTVDNIQGKGFTRIKWNGSPETFMELGMSPSRYRYVDGKEYIWGMPPTYEVAFDTAAIQAGRDPQLEKALTLIQ